MEINIFTLANGIRIVHKETPGAAVAHCGFLIDVGSRDEEEHEQGLAHYIEHVLFKGTSKRRAFHILNRLDAVGGEINAYTTKESTCIFASFLTEHFERAFELLKDITFDSVFPEKEIEREKDVIIDEINSYLDSPSEQIFDDFEDQMFKGHPLGRNILGTISSVRNFTRNDILNFIKKHYTPERIVFSVVGNFTGDYVKKLTDKYLSQISKQPNLYKRQLFKGYKPDEQTHKKTTYQAHYTVGNVAYSRKNKKKIPLILLNNMLGGPAMNSRLNLAIREKFGYTYNLESNYSAYSDTGLFSVYLGTDIQFLNKTINLVKKELDKFREKKLGAMQLHYGKKQLIGQIAMAQENKAGLMLAIGKSLLYTGKVETLPDIFAKIENISADELLVVANEIFNEKKLSSLTYLPK
ncbi:MAG: insulinase family protein [Bacteroidota bacterium]|nr:insulinase family protein [Bacteroidota bacterium]